MTWQRNTYRTANVGNALGSPDLAEYLRSISSHDAARLELALYAAIRAHRVTDTAHKALVTLNPADQRQAFLTTHQHVTTIRVEPLEIDREDAVCTAPGGFTTLCANSCASLSTRILAP